MKTTILNSSNHETFEWKNTKLVNEQKMLLDKEALAKTIIVSDPFSSEASSTNGSHGVTVGCVGYPWLAFWSPNAPFVCIEPWHSHTDFDEVKVPFEEREGTLFVAAHRSWTTAYSIRVW